MAQDTSWRDYNTELVQVIFEMGRTSDFEDRRRIFRRELHRSFDPEFFPSLVELLGVMGQVAQGNEKNQIIVLSIFAAITLELRDFLSDIEPQSLSPMAVLLNVLVGPLAAELYPPEGKDPGVELAKGFIRLRERIVAQ